MSLSSKLATAGYAGLIFITGAVIGRYAERQPTVAPYYVNKPHLTVGSYLPASETYDCFDQMQLHRAQKLVKYCLKQRLQKER